jgi:pantothenate kinase type III
VTVVATGTHARTVGAASHRIDHVDEDLTLTGLRLVAERSSI